MDRIAEMDDCSDNRIWKPMSSPDRRLTEADIEATPDLCIPPSFVTNTRHSMAHRKTYH